MCADITGEARMKVMSEASCPARSVRQVPKSPSEHRTPAGACVPYRAVHTARTEQLERGSVTLLTQGELG